MNYYGFKLGLRVSRLGMIVAFPLLPARPHDVNFLGDLLEGFSGVAPADKGFIDAFGQALLLERQAIVLVTPRRKGMAPSPHPPALRGAVLGFASAWRRWVRT
jgi:hypothetical protein